MGKNEKISISKFELEKIIATSLNKILSQEKFNNSNEELLTIAQICDFLKISKSTLYNHLANGLPSKSLNKKRYFSKSEVLKYINKK